MMNSQIIVGSQQSYGVPSQPSKNDQNYRKQAAAMVQNGPQNEFNVIREQTNEENNVKQGDFCQQNPQDDMIIEIQPQQMPSVDNLYNEEESPVQSRITEVQKSIENLQMGSHSQENQDQQKHEQSTNLVEAVNPEMQTLSIITNIKHSINDPLANSQKQIEQLNQQTQYQSHSNQQTLGHIDAQKILNFDNKVDGSICIQKIEETLKNMGVPLNHVDLEVRVQTDAQFESTQQTPDKKFFLDTKDLQNVFQLYGQIECIKMSDNKCSAIITFQNAINASLACLSLNRRWLSVNQAYLYVNIVNPKMQVEKETEVHRQIQTDTDCNQLSNKYSPIDTKLNDQSNLANGAFTDQVVNQNRNEGNQVISKNNVSVKSDNSQTQGIANFQYQQQSSHNQNQMIPSQQFLQDQQQTNPTHFDRQSQILSQTQFSNHLHNYPSNPNQFANMQQAYQTHQFNPKIVQQNYHSNQHLTAQNFQGQSNFQSFGPQVQDINQQFAFGLHNQDMNRQQLPLGYQQNLGQNNFRNCYPVSSQQTFGMHNNQKQVFQVFQEEQDIKFTCRYEVQIENENRFQVARRIIGTKGANMKRIIEECNHYFEYNPETQSASIDGVKLRLRGRGSGFLEGPEQKESNEPLNLCVSSKDKDKYQYACYQVDKLLQKVYFDFRQFDKQKNFKNYNTSCYLEVKKDESITGPKSLFDHQNKDLSNNSIYNSISPVQNTQFAQNSHNRVVQPNSATTSKQNNTNGYIQGQSQSKLSQLGQMFPQNVIQMNKFQGEQSSLQANNDQEAQKLNYQGQLNSGVPFSRQQISHSNYSQSANQNGEFFN